VSLRAALAFLTPVGGAAAPGPSSRAWFPVVGAAVGALVGATRWAAGAWWPALLAGVLAVAVDAAATGMLHLDGLADSADGLLAPMERARRLAVMRQADVGAFGVVTVVLVLALRAGALAALDGDADAVVAVAALWAVSRAAMAVVPAVVPYARAGGGLATAFGAARGPAVVAAAVAVVGGGVAVAVVGAPAHLAGGLVGVVAGAAVVVGLARQRLGGFTGDVLGAAGVVGETVGLLVLVAR
jgi:adenosylcobinamide-GDP ribazoletransferase